MPNPYSSLLTALATELATLSSGYTGLAVVKKRFDPAALPAFDRYLIVVSPAENEPWTEKIIAVRHFQYVMNVDLFLLVKNFDDVNSLLGETTPNKGLFELVDDVKDLLRTTTLSGTLDKTYSEAAGPLHIEYAATAGFDSGEKAFVRRARLRYKAGLPSFCWPITP